ncbi:enoyl-CoA hydratase/isomerase family protein [Rhodovibrionaceae bacterium A322]
MAQTYETLTLEVSENIATLTLNRPDDANALNPQMGADLFQAALACQGNSEVRAVIITAKGKLFCGGGDLKAFHDCGDGLPPVLMETATLLHNAISVLNRMDAPVIMAINGTAGGAGLSLVCAGDLAISSDKAKFTLAYTGAGLTPDGSSTYFLAKNIGLRRAKEMALLNRVLSAEEALDWGLINQVVSPENLMDEARKLATRLAAGPTLAYGEAKRLLLDGATQALESQMDAEARAIANISKTRDARHGMESFLKKEKPSFSGQ